LLKKFTWRRAKSTYLKLLHRQVSVYLIEIFEKCKLAAESVFPTFFLNQNTQPPGHLDLQHILQNLKKCITFKSIYHFKKKIEGINQHIILFRGRNQELKCKRNSVSETVNNYICFMKVLLIHQQNQKGRATLLCQNHEKSYS
jgi:hypothetical protein